MTKVILPADMQDVIIEFIRMSLFEELISFVDGIEVVENSYDSEDTTDFYDIIRPMLILLHKIESSPDENVEFTEEEVQAFDDMSDYMVFEVIRKDTSIDNPAWLMTVLKFKEMCQIALLNK